MPLSVYAILFVIGFSLLTGCGSTNTAYFFDDSGGGKMTTTVDIGAMMTSLKEVFPSTESQNDNSNTDEVPYSEMYDTVDTTGGDSTQDYTDSELKDSQPKEDNSSLQDNSGSPLNDKLFRDIFDMRKVDTIIHILSALPDSTIEHLERPDLIDRVNIHVDMDQNRDKGLIAIMIDFNHLGQINEINNELIQLMALLDNKVEMSEEELNLYQLHNEALVFNLENRYVFMPEDTSSVFEFIGGKEALDTYAQMEEEQLDMILSYIGHSEMKLSFHLPYPINDVETIHNYELYNNDYSVDLYISVKQVIKEKKVGGYKIKF